MIAIRGLGSLSLEEIYGSAPPVDVLAAQQRIAAGGTNLDDYELFYSWRSGTEAVQAPARHAITSGAVQYINQQTGLGLKLPTNSEPEDLSILIPYIEKEGYTVSQAEQLISQALAEASQQPYTTWTPYSEEVLSAAEWLGVENIPTTSLQATVEAVTAPRDPCKSAYPPGDWRYMTDVNAVECNAYIESQGGGGAAVGPMETPSTPMTDSGPQPQATVSDIVVGAEDTQKTIASQLTKDIGVAGVDIPVWVLVAAGVVGFLVLKGR